MDPRPSTLRSVSVLQATSELLVRTVLLVTQGAPEVSIWACAEPANAMDDLTCVTLNLECATIARTTLTEITVRTVNQDTKETVTTNAFPLTPNQM